MPRRLTKPWSSKIASHPTTVTSASTSSTDATCAASPTARSSATRSHPSSPWSSTATTVDAGRADKRSRVTSELLLIVATRR